MSDMTKVSRKTIRKKNARTRTDHPAGCRINDVELAAVLADIDELAQAGGPRPSVGSYTKHALLSYSRFRKLEARLRALYNEHKGACDGFATDIVAGSEPNAPGGEYGQKPTVPAFEAYSKMLVELNGILGAR